MRSKKLIKGAFLNTLNLTAQILSGFYVLPLMIHAFGDANFGIWILVASFMGFAAVLDLGLPSAVSRFISQAIGRGGQEGEREIKLITATAFYIFISITLLSVLLIGIAILLAPAMLKDPAQIDLFRKLLLILCINNLFVFPTSVFEGILTANLRHDLISSRKIVFTVIRVASTIFLVKNNYGLIVIAWATVICNITDNLVRSVLAYRVDPRVSIAWANFTPSKIRQLFSYSVYTFIGKIADLLRFQINSFVITVFTDVALVTPYRVASRLIEYFMQFIGEIVSVFNPYFSQEEGKSNHEGIKEKFLFITKIVTYIATFAGLMLLLFGKNFIERWVGPQYSISYKILVILVIPITFALIQSTVFPLLYGISKHKFFAYTNIGEGVLNLIISIILVKKYGIIGVALGAAIPLLITKFFIQPLYVTKILNISLKRYFLVILGPFILTVVTLIIPWLEISRLLKPNYANLVFFGAVQTLIFILVVYCFGFSKTEKDFVFGIFKLKKLKS
jgi:O-antigen/teichoic acid export membrane protein